MNIQGKIKPKEYTFEDGKNVVGYVLEVQLPNGKTMELPVKKAKVELLEAYMSK